MGGWPGKDSVIQPGSGVCTQKLAYFAEIPFRYVTTGTRDFRLSFYKADDDLYTKHKSYDTMRYNVVNLGQDPWK